MTILIEQLRYVSLGASNIENSSVFAGEILGLQASGDGTGLAYFRSDFRDFTLLFDASAECDGVGFEVRDAASLDLAASAIAGAGLRPISGTPADCAKYRAKAMIRFNDHSGNRIDILWRPVTTGWRFFGSRDRNMQGLQSVALRSTAIDRDEALWTSLFSARVVDRVGDTVYLGMDKSHHRLALYPSTRPGVLSTSFEVKGIDDVMQASYDLPASQVRIVHGPGSEPVSGRLFVTFEGPDRHLFTLATAMETPEPGRLPRQFPQEPGSYCGWGSETMIPEMQA